MTEQDENTLVSRSAAGDQAAFVALIHRHEQPLTSLIRRMVGNRADAEDVLQETLIQAWLTIGRLRDPARARSWLLQVARNRCRDYWKSSQRRDLPTEAADLEACMNRFGRSSARARSEEVLDALDVIPAASAEMVRLFYLEGLTVADIAQRSACPEGTVKRRLFTAREQMRVALALTTQEGSRDE